MADIRVRAKMRCELKEPWSDGHRIVLRPVYDEDPNSENGQFFKYTPAGQVDLSTINLLAADQFEVGKEYYVDFTPAG